MTSRALEAALASFGLLLLSPLLAVIGVLIKLDSTGPALFVQERVGRYGKRFRIIKFRTMVVDQAPGSLKLTPGDDSRITRIGRILRRYKLDELPQLWNVLVGEMSFVGPRPEVPAYVATYPLYLKNVILSVRPGITDPSSVQFKDESLLLRDVIDPERVYLEEILPKKLDISRRYIEHRTGWTDLRIVWQTVKELLN